MHQHDTCYNILNKLNELNCKEETLPECTLRYDGCRYVLGDDSLDFSCSSEPICFQGRYNRKSQRKQK